MQLDAAIANVRWFADAASRGPGGSFERELPPDTRQGVPPSSSLLVAEPIGVVAAMTAYNFPYILTAWKVAGALAAGCSVILNPSPRATLSSAALFELIAELDLPAGVASFLVGDAEVGRVLSSDPAVDLVSFTGSIAVGAQVMAQAAPRSLAFPKMLESDTFLRERIVLGNPRGTPDVPAEFLAGQAQPARRGRNLETLSAEDAGGD